MLDRSLTPSITVTIGRDTRLYFAFITTAPTELDSPATITLRADTLLELSCYAEDPFSLDTTRSRYASRPSPLRLRDSAEALGRVKASLAALAAGAALTRPAHFARRPLSERRGFWNERRDNPCWTSRSHPASR